MKSGRNWGRLGMKYKLGDVSIINPRETIKKGNIAKKVDMAVLQPFTRKIPSFELLEYKGGTKFRNGDTIMARITPCLENGKTSQVSILDDNEIGFGSTEYIVFRAKEGISDCNFLYYLVCSDIVRDPAIKSMVGSSGRQRVQTDVIQNLEIDLPSFETQKQIASILSALDDKIELNNRINENLESQAQAIFKAWFVDFEPFGGVMPEDWKIGMIKDIIELHDSKRIPLSGSEREKMDKIYPYYGATSCMDYVDNYIFDGKYLLLGEDGTVIDKNGYPILQYVEGKFWVNNHAHIITGKLGYTVEILYLLFKQTNVKHIVTGAVQPKISQANLKKVPVTISSIKDLDAFNNIIQPIFAMIRKNRNENEKLALLRDTLLPKLMNGEIDVSEVKI